jgi:phospho-N-acetylmuramoyl-pentapeptide-transferase
MWIPFFDTHSLLLDPTASIAWGTFLLIACCNAVNLTDGLDGLATECLIPNMYTILFLLTVLSNNFIAESLGIATQDISMLVIPAAALLGSLFGFLWFNTYPALVFMGDVGSLALGAAVGYLFFQTHYELLLIISGIVFVIETVSVILQVCCYKLVKKRLFKMAPLHHHCELGGMHEARIVKRFSMVSWSSAALLMLTFLTYHLYHK